MHGIAAKQPKDGSSNFVLLVIEFRLRSTVPIFDVLTGPFERLVNMALIACDRFSTVLTIAYVWRVNSMAANCREEGVTGLGHLAVVAETAR